MALWLARPSLAPPFKVVDDYTSELQVGELLGGEEGKATALEKQRKRQRSWMERDSAVDCATWQPEKRPRLASYHFCRYLDNQASVGVSVGLSRRSAQGIWTPRF